jgi:hypothetical protein
VSRNSKDIHLILTFLSGAQQEFAVTDKYKKKRTIKNWGKPCIWLNNRNPLDVVASGGAEVQWKRDWLVANCVFVNLEHRLFIPDPIVPPMFHPVPQAPIQLPEVEEELEYIDPPLPDVVVTSPSAPTPPPQPTPHPSVLGKRARLLSPTPPPHPKELGFAPVGTVREHMRVSWCSVEGEHWVRLNDITKYKKR